MSQQVRYCVNPAALVRGPRDFVLSPEIVVAALRRSRLVINQVKSIDVDVFGLLGMRNLSAFVGEVFSVSLSLEADGSLVKNPHQDGYPDLLLMDDEGRKRWVELESRRREKAPFSPFEAGGFEVKATCGSVPSPSQCVSRGCVKPDLGDQRIALMTGYDWKAHHRETNRLFGLIWDFIGGLPTVVAVFYRNDLNQNDWGRIVTPRAGGGRTTSVSIMARGGIEKMYAGWIAVIDDLRYARFLDRKNRQSLIVPVVQATFEDSQS